AMTADYARFIEDYLGEKYREARRLVKEVAPHQLVSFRMQHTGDPTYRGPSMIPYPAEAFVDAVDIFEPEAYGRIGNWERIRPGYFTAAYLRALNPNLPVFWAEIGQSCWSVSEGEATDEGKERVARFYEDFHKMLIGSHANGVAFWWYPGGYRVNEKSDYGVINPDGTDRPVTQVIREWGAKFRESGPVPEPNSWLEIPREWTPGGIVGKYDRVQEQYWNLIDQGNEVGLR
ncbi:MAG: hypothetical protein KC964_01905, partial [Candidatus Omnitrophica bacterium]|nr:hypothetical protein [Candidatus Omnitrophota bacterium]